MEKIALKIEIEATTKKKSNIYYTKQAFSRDCSILIWRHLKSRDMLIIQFIFLSDPIYGKI